MDSGEVTRLLRAWRDGDEGAFQELVPLVYDELKRLAHRYMRQAAAGHTLQTTAVVHDAYIRLVHASPVDWHDRTHFFAVCAQVMRRVLVDYERQRESLKRGGGVQLVSLEDTPETGKDGLMDLFALDEALTRLACLDARKAKVVELRFFGGLTVAEAAQVLKISPGTVIRDWDFAKAWLRRDLDTGRRRAC
ncbi:MAG: sigma-70 family RNA polymerase sigma factor [Bryobacteraceae bacterium]|jgi:RNA polymerase sigma factor (TIGR02999 family)